MDTKEKQQHPHQQKQLPNSFFDGGLYSNVHPLHDSSSFRRHSPSLPSSDSCATSMSQTSESRRNSNDGLDTKEDDKEESGLCSVFDKLNTDNFEERRYATNWRHSLTFCSIFAYTHFFACRNSSPGAKQDDDYVKPCHRSMSVDVGSMQRKLPLSASSSCSTRHGGNSLADSAAAGANNIHDLLSRSLLFDNKSGEVFWGEEDHDHVVKVLICLPFGYQIYHHSLLPRNLQEMIHICADTLVPLRSYPLLQARIKGTMDW